MLYICVWYKYKLYLCVMYFDEKEFYELKSVNLFFYVENGKLGWVLILNRLILLIRYN